ncbi:8-amino-7-oxononanoate synthase [Reinekea blandensis]|uniref:8-amino-7-oxononanoate synthase n=1 Tax=Reinekea blandensis MED297 TaxID=314283 RepID=A4BGD5_9GAMM|nr:8-amino-7-oxononanoate synthase [Reinekea blandensis]EAR08741.1 8-amino-7-oxononanoate synthase [Reinekea sp. MED297] [Reinekea blandensis MED297]
MKQFSDMSAVLAARHRDGLLRQRVELQSAQSVTPIIDGKPLLSFCSNDYLGLAGDDRIAQAMSQAVERYGVGAGASHLIDGHHHEHERLEQELAEFCGREAALVFSTGYMANIGVIQALLTRHDTVIQDRLNHASLIDGGRLSGAKFSRYAHNDSDNLAQQLDRASGKKLVVTDGVFSMDGDKAPLDDLASVCRSHDAWLMVDDAHGFGVLGTEGAGLVSEFGLTTEDVPVVIGTLGKAFGTSGAFVAGDQLTIDYLLQYARSYIYTTASPPAVAAATRASLAIVRNSNDRRAHLTALIQKLRAGIQALGLTLMPSETPIQPILIGESHHAMQLSQALKARGILVTAIRPPTVPEGTARLRVTLSAQHSEAQVDTLLNTLESLL